jgi:hypothetical protein
MKKIGSEKKLNLEYIKDLQARFQKLKEHL